MTGHGFYNQHSLEQALAAEAAIGMVQRASEVIPLDGTAVCCADFGCAQGHNSMHPLRVLIEGVRRRASEVPIMVVHTDLPGNDFTTLFRTLDDPTQSYLFGRKNVYGFAEGKGFYGNVFPDHLVAFGWCSIATHWLSQVPTGLRDQIFSPLASPDEKARWRDQANQDWRDFLTNRAREMKPGGEIVLVNRIADDEGITGAEGIMSLANDVIRTLVDKGTITAEQHAKMALPTFYRTEREYLDPIQTGEFADRFEVIEHEVDVLPDAYYAETAAKGDSIGYGLAAAGFFRGFSEAPLFGSLGQGGKPIADGFYARLAALIARHPDQAKTSWRVMAMRIRRKDL